MNSYIPSRASSRTRSRKASCASQLHASQPEISAAARRATSGGTVRSSQRKKSGSSISGE